MLLQTRNTTSILSLKTKMKNRKQQLLNDSALLSLRIEYLSKFVQSRMFSKLSVNDKELLQLQVYSMKALSSILKIRIDIVNSKSPAK